jgi:hypothetical protein
MEQTRAGLLIVIQRSEVTPSSPARTFWESLGTRGWGEQHTVCNKEAGLKTERYAKRTR